jgi:hypothetical protein
MFKFLRKYNKLMLAVFGVLLMITFLIPQAFDKFSQRSGASGAVYATIGDGDKIRGADRERAQRELELLEKLGIRLPGLGAIRQPEHWYLLVREADDAGLIGTGQSVPIPEETLQTILANTGERDVSLIQDTYAKYIGVMQMMNLYQTGGLYSDRRLRSAAELLMHQAFVQIVPIRAESDKAQVDPTEQQIAEQFAKYADKLPVSDDARRSSDDETESMFGYKLPDRVKLEWLKIPSESVRRSIEQSEAFSNVALRLHWRRNPNQTFPAVDENAAVPQEVRDDLLAKLTSEKLDEIAKYASDQLRLNRRGLREQDGYVVLPEDWEEKKLDLQQLAADIQKKYGIDLPAYESTGDRWTAVSEVGKVHDIGGTTTDKFGMPIRFAQLIESTKEFNGTPLAAPMQKDVAGPPLKGVDGSVFIFRIIGADPAHKPSSVDEVRDAVVADLKRQSHFEQLEKSAAEIELDAEKRGLLALAMEHDTAVENANVSLTDMFTMQQRLQYGLPLTIDPQPLPGIGQSRAANEAIIRYSLSLPEDTLIDNLTEEQRTFVVPVRDRLALAVVRIMRSNPLTLERFAELAQKNAIQQLVGSEEIGKTNTLEEGFGFDALAKRHKYVPSREQEQEDKQPPAESAAKAD